MTSRILHLRASNFIGGPEKQILRYAGYERNSDSQVFVATFVGAHEGHKFKEDVESHGFICFQIPDAGILTMARHLANLVREQEIRLVCTHGYKPLIVARVARLFAEFVVVPFLLGWTAEDSKVRLYEALERKLLPGCDSFVCLAESQIARAHERVRRLTIPADVVVNAVDEICVSADQRHRIRVELQRRFAIPEGATILSCAGRLSPEKGTEVFLRAADVVCRSNSEAFFVVFGDGPLKHHLTAFANSLEFRDRIRFAGFQPDFTRLLAGIDIFINPSLSEESPNVLTEAMAAGVPIVATDVGNVRDMAGEPNAFCLVPPGDVNLLATKIVRLLADRELRDRIREAGLSRVRQVFSPETQQQQLRRVYQRHIPWLGGNERPEHLPFISVVMPVRNEEAHIASVLRQLAEQDYPRTHFEILVADGCSTDSTSSVVTEFARQSPLAITLLHNARKLSSAGRNAGAKAARGEIVVFVDGHCQIPGRDFLADTARLMTSSGAACLSRPQPLTYPGNSWLQRLIAAARQSTFGHGRDSTIFSLTYSGPVDPTSSGASYKRDVFSKIGYYDESFDACEDVEFNHRVKVAGLKSIIDPGVTVFYQPRNSIKALFRQLFRYGRGRLRLVVKHPTAFSFSQVIPALFVVYAFCLIPFLLASPWTVKLAAATPLALYFVLSLAYSSRLAFRNGVKALFVGPLVYGVIHSALGCGFLLQAFSQLSGRNTDKSGSQEPLKSRGQSSGI